MQNIFQDSYIYRKSHFTPNTINHGMDIVTLYLLKKPDLRNKDINLDKAGSERDFRKRNSFWQNKLTY